MLVQLFVYQLTRTSVTQFFTGINIRFKNILGKLIAKSPRFSSMITPEVWLIVSEEELPVIKYNLCSRRGRLIYCCKHCD